MGGSRSHLEFFVLFVKSAQNSPKPVVILCSSIACILSVYALLKVVGYCDVSRSVHVSDGFQKKVWMDFELYPIFLGFLEFFYFAKPLHHLL